MMIIAQFYPSIGGAEQECRKIAKKLAEKGHQVSILTQYRDGLAAADVVDGIPVYRKIRGWHLYELTYMLSVFILLLRYRRSFDVICCFGLYLYIAPAILFRFLTGKRVLVRLESGGATGDLVNAEQLSSGALTLRCASRADGIIAISRQIEEELLARGFPVKKVFRIPNSVDTEIFSPAAHVKNQDIPVISYIGRLTRGKGVELFIEALTLLRQTNPEFKVFVVGGGEQRSCLEELVHARGMNDRITFTGEIADAPAIVTYYQHSYLIVMPSYSEGMPLVLLEAMACGVPVVASRVGGMTDVISLPEQQQPEPEGYWIGAHGILVPPGDVPALTAAIKRLLSDSELHRELSRKAREVAVNTYSLETVIQHYVKHITGALE
jgi:glycosyltransferase involved in cell wall biosynthesis